MLKKSLLTIGVGLTIVSFGLSQAQPAQAFWLELPTSLKALLQQVRAEDTGSMSAGDSGDDGTIEDQPVDEDQGMTPPADETDTEPGNTGTAPPPAGQSPTTNQAGNNPPLIKGDANGKISDPKKMLQELKRGGAQMEGDLNRFQNMIDDGQQKGLKVPADLITRVKKADTLIKKLRGAQSLNDVKKINPDELDSTMNSLDGDRQNLQQQNQDGKQQKQQLARLKKEASSRLKGLKTVDQQIAQLTKLKIAIPSTISEQLKKVKTAFNTVGSATTADEAQTANGEATTALADLQNAQQTLTTLSRLPQVKKQSDQLLIDLNKEIKKTKTTVAKLSKTGTDLSSVLTEFQTAIDKLKIARDAALEKIKSGDVEGGLSDFQTEVFAQANDVRQFPETIQIMGSVGQFAGTFKQQLTAASRQIKSLKAQKHDTAQLEALFNDMQGKGQAVLDAMKAQPVDTDAILQALQDFQTARLAFQDAVEQLKPAGTDNSTIAQ